MMQLWGNAKGFWGHHQKLGERQGTDWPSSEAFQRSTASCSIVPGISFPHFLDWAFSSVPVTVLRKSHWLLSLQDFFKRTIASVSLHQRLLSLRVIFPSNTCPSRMNTGHLNVGGVRVDKDESYPEEQYLIKPWFFFSKLQSSHS